MTETQIPPIPAEVAAAIVAVMADVQKLGKGDRNSHANYNFASVDDFLEAVRPLCAKHGLLIIQDEQGFEMKEGQNKRGEAVRWLLMRFSFTLAHSSGVTWAHSPTRSIMVDASMGSQAFGAAQSYALKQFERSLFQIATGDKEDADSHAPGNLPEAGRKTPDKPPPKDAAQEEKEQWRKFVVDLCERIDEQPDTRFLADLWVEHTTELQKLKAFSAKAYAGVVERFNKRGLKEAA